MNPGTQTLKIDLSAGDTEIDVNNLNHEEIN